MATIRTFIAVELPAPVRDTLGALVEELAGSWEERAVRWVKPESMHLSLRFLGDTDTEKVRELSAGLDEAVDGVAPFALRVQGMGCFPNPRRPRVIWVGREDPEARLLPLQKAVERRVRSLGWEREKRVFRPHLTLGRVRDRARPPEGEWMREPQAMTFQVDSVDLIESQLKPTGAEYTTLHRAAMQQP